MYVTRFMVCTGRAGVLITAAAVLAALFVMPRPVRANWTVMPGQGLPGPAAVWSPDTKKLYVVVDGPDNNLWFATLGRDKIMRTPYVKIPGIRPQPPALVWDPERHKIDILVLADDDSLWFGSLNTDGTLYSPWKTVRGNFASPPALVWNPLLKRVSVLGRSANDRLWFATLNADGSLYSEWASVPGTSPSAPATAWDSSLQKIQVLVRTSNDFLMWATLNPDGTVYRSFNNITGTTVSAPSLIFDSHSSRLFAFVRGGDNEVWVAQLNSDGTIAAAWKPVSGRLVDAPAVALNTDTGTAYLVASMPFDYAAGTYTFVDDFALRPRPAKAAPLERRPSKAYKAAVRNVLESPWWRHFYSFNYADLHAREGRPYPRGFLLESLTSAYAPSYFPRTGGVLVKLWLSTGDYEHAKDVLRYTLDVAAKAGLNRVPHYVLTSGQVEMTDQIDGQASIILAWALYARQANDPAFVASTYRQVAGLLDATMNPPYFDPAFGLIRNSHFEHFREAIFWDTYDMFTQSFAAQALIEMSRVAKSRGDTAHAQAWQHDETILSNAIAKKLTWKFDGAEIYAEMFENGSTTQKYLGLSEFNFGPTAAAWEGVDSAMYARTIAALMKYGSFVWHGHRVISIGFTKDEDVFPITSGKSLAWQMLYYAQRGNWKQVAQTLAFIQDEQQRNGEPRVYESSQVKISETGADVFNGAGNGEQTAWMLYALSEVRKLAR